MSGTILRRRDRTARPPRVEHYSSAVNTWVEKVEARNDGVRVHAFDLLRDGSRRIVAPRTGEPPRPAGAQVTPVDCDTVVLCTARRSNDGLYRAIKRQREAWPERGIRGVYLAGDCYAPRYLADAVFDGHRVAREFESATPSARAP